MTVPTIHANGSSKQWLIETLCNASNALDVAYEALKQSAPNGRDYYPQGSQAMKSAEEEHMARLKAVDAVKSQIDRLMIAIDEQN